MCKNLTFAAITMMAICMTTASCSSDNDSSVIEPMDNQQTARKAHLRLVCGMNVGVSSDQPVKRNAPATRAVLTANGRDLTDIYILDYDKATGKLLQVLHQTSTATDFAEPDLTLDYGEHTLKVIATRSDTPSLLTADGTAWNTTANVLTPVTASVPLAVTSNKTSDTFGKQVYVTVGVGEAQTVNIILERLVAKLVVNSTDDFPADCSTITLDMDEYKSFSWTDFSVIDCAKNQRTTDVSALAGQHATTINYFFLVPDGGYTTDITFTTNSTKGAPYSTITVPSVPLERNKVTTITGSLYNHQQGFSIALNDEWDGESNDINI